ncbi:MAG: hypothetical protein ABII27_02380 [bacterium]
MNRLRVIKNIFNKVRYALLGVYRTFIKEQLRFSLKFFAAIFFCSLIAFTACGKDKIKRSEKIFNEGATNQFDSIYVVYDDEMLTGGEVSSIPGGESQEIDLEHKNNPFGGKNSVKYIWDGGDVFDYNTGEFQNSFAGLKLSIASSGDNSTARNFTDAGYTKVVFYLRGVLSSNVSVKAEGPDDGDNTTVGSSLIISEITLDWQRYSFNISPNDLDNINDFFKLTLIYDNPAGTTNNGEGGTVYLDNIYYEK